MKLWKARRMRPRFNFRSGMRRLLLLAAIFPFAALAYVSPGGPSGFVSDFAGVLSEPQRTGLETKLQNFKNTTGSEVAVVFVRTLGGDTIENYANELFTEWGIGEKGKDNGILFLVAVLDREMRIEVGYGLEGALTDAQAYWIEQNVAVPAFRTQDYYAGANGVIQKIIGAISGEEMIPTATPAPGANFSFSEVLWLLIILPIWLASILSRSKSWWLGGVLGGMGGIVLGFIFGFLYTGVIAFVLLVPLGLLFDFAVSRAYQKGKATGHYPWWIGGGRGFGGRGWGGFGGGSSGGGGASSRW